MTIGVPAHQLSDDELRHELLQLKTKQADIAADGTSQQQDNHRRRTAELEAEFLQRFGSAHDEQPAADQPSQPDEAADRAAQSRAKHDEVVSSSDTAAEVAGSEGDSAAPDEPANPDPSEPG